MVQSHEVETAMLRLKAFPRKLDTDDVDPELWQAAEEYALAYDGDFEFMVSMRSTMRSAMHLSAGQAKGVLNCMRAEAQRSKEEGAPMWEGEPSTIPDGTYTVVFQDGGHVTLDFRIRDFDGDKKQVISFLYGPDNSRDFSGFAFAFKQGFYVWKRFQDGYDKQIAAARMITGMTEEQRKEAGIEYAKRSIRCYVCGTKLTNPDSLQYGTGPICGGRE
jgi:hypothetical protein